MMMTSIEKYLKRFEVYKNGELSPEEEQAFLEELKENNEMLAAWNEYMDMMEAFSDNEAVSLREKLDKAFYKQQNNHVRYISQNILFRSAAAALVVMVMGVLLYFFCSSDQPFQGLASQDYMVEPNNIDLLEIKARDGICNDSIIQESMPTKEIVNVAPIASIYDSEEYQISPVFAELLHNVYRSGWFKLNAPVDSVIFSNGDSILFSWETNIDDNLYFDILDRNGQVVYRHKGSVSSPWSFIPMLEPAIYMFRFATENEPVWMGVMVKE